MDGLGTVILLFAVFCLGAHCADHQVPVNKFKEAKENCDSPVVSVSNKKFICRNGLVGEFDE